MSTLLEVRQLGVRYLRGAGAGGLAAVQDVSFSVSRGEALGLVGESGCGKTSVGRALLRLLPWQHGELHWQGRRVDGLPERAFRPLRRGLQMVFQDPHGSLDPRMTIAESVAEPLRALHPGLGTAARRERALARLAEVGLAAEAADRFPHQFSGGQLQRVGIARALVVDPEFIVCDEPVSALDVSVQGQIVNLLARIKRERGLASLFISHNLAVVAHLCERILVMYLGRIVESAPRADLLDAPLHPYTRMLLDAVPDPGTAARRGKPRHAAADPGIAEAPATGCAFANRCRHALAQCAITAPELREFSAGRAVACHRATEWPAGLPSRHTDGEG